MTCINASATALDTNPAYYTVDVDLGNGQHKYVVYDNLAEAQADIQAHANVGLVWNNGQYVWNPNSTFTAAPTTPAPVNINPAPAAGAPIPGSAINATPAAAAPVITGTQMSTGDITGVTLTKSGNGATVDITVGHNAPGEQMTYDLMVMINGTWIQLKQYGPFPGDPSSYDTKHSFQVDYAELTQLVQSQGATALTIGAGAQIGINANFPTGHNQGITTGGSAGGPFNLP